MRRRDFIKVIAAPAMGWPLAARAQSSTKMARIGMLYIGLADAQSALRELGYVEGQNIAFEFRSAEGKLDRLPGLASELVRLKVDVIVALYVPSALAAKQATRDIPIVIIAADPVETGIVPGPGASGRKHYRHISDVCRIQCKKHRTVPGYVALRATCGGIRQHERFCIRESYARQVLRAGGPTGTEIQPVMRIREPDEAESAFVAMVRERVDAVVIQGSLAIKSVTDLAIKYRLRTASSTRTFADIGGLMGPTRWRGADF